MKPETQQVTVEILTGEAVTKNFVKLAMTRNRSQQVKNQSLAELDNSFDWIKEIVASEPYANDIIYKENENGTVSIEHIVWLMTVVNIRLFPDIHSNCGIRPKAAMNEYIKANKEYGLTIKNPFYSARNILLDLIKVYDYIETHFGDDCKSYGKFKFVKVGKYTSTFYKTKLKYKSPNQFVYPVVSSLRAIIGVNEESGELFWKIDPFEFIERALPALASIQIEIYKNDGMLERCRARETYRTLYREAICTFREMNAGV